MSAGHIRRRGKASWELKFDVGRAPATGRRLIQYHSFRGTKREAQMKLAQLIASVGQGTYVEPSKVTVAEHLRARVDQWEAAGDISGRTAQRYRQLVENQIVPHLGDRLLQKLKRVDIEGWHTALRSGGRRRGSGGVAARTIGHAHRVLSKSLSDAAKDDLITRNVCKIEAAPKVEETELRILKAHELRTLLAKLQDHPLAAAAITAIFTGMRLGEILALRWANTDLENGLIRVREALEETKAHGIRFKAPKTKRGRRDITLPDVVIRTLRDHRRRQLELRMQLGLGKLPEDALVFPTIEGSAASPSNVSRQ
jgi:integrase